MSEATVTSRPTTCSSHKCDTFTNERTPYLDLVVTSWRRGKRGDKKTEGRKGKGTLGNSWGGQGTDGRSSMRVF